MKRISETPLLYDALKYPLLFVNEVNGSHLNIPKAKTESAENKPVSTMDYYAYHLMIPPNIFSHLPRCQQLLHQWAVHMYAKTESE